MAGYSLATPSTSLISSTTGVCACQARTWCSSKLRMRRGRTSTNRSMPRFGLYLNPCDSDRVPTSRAHPQGARCAADPAEVPDGGSIEASRDLRPDVSSPPEPPRVRFEVALSLLSVAAARTGTCRFRKLSCFGWAAPVTRAWTGGHEPPSTEQTHGVLGADVLALIMLINTTILGPCS